MSNIEADRYFIAQLRYGVEEVRNMMDSILRDEADDEPTIRDYECGSDEDLDSPEYEERPLHRL